MSNWFIYDNNVYNRDAFEQFIISKKEVFTFDKTLDKKHDYFIEALHKYKSYRIKLGFSKFYEAKAFLEETIFSDLEYIKLKDK
jgi:hypothetical protein